MARVAADFAASDSDSNGRLNFEEYLVFMDKQKAHLIEQGQWHEPLPNHFQRSYALYNAVSGEEEGFTMAQFFQCSMVVLGHWGAVKAADA